jgi:hypothetical protein
MPSNPADDLLAALTGFGSGSGSSFRRRRQNRAAGGVVLVIGMLLAAFFAVWYANAWTDMLMIGIAHRDWLHNMPTIGFAGARPLAFMETLGLGLGALFLAGRSRS